MVSSIRRLKLEKVFASFDADHDGFVSRDDVISLAELWCGTYNLPPAGDERRVVHECANEWWIGLTAMLDRSHDCNRVHREEWVACSEKEEFEEFVERVAIPFSMSVFRIADGDGDGRIGLAEMAAAQSKSGMSDKETRDVFDSLDNDRDGYVTSEEYTWALKAFYMSDDSDEPGNLLAGQL
jgi:Ca2+-binding EF-hand superfamily protein